MKLGAQMPNFDEDGYQLFASVILQFHQSDSHEICVMVNNV
jgi:hypothetical protein